MRRFQLPRALVWSSRTYLWSQNGDFKIWHPKKKYGIENKPVLKKETLALKHLYGKQLHWHWKRNQLKQLKSENLIILFQWDFLYFSMTILRFFLHVTFFFSDRFFYNVSFFSVSLIFSFNFLSVLTSRGSGLRGGASRAWFAYNLRR